MGACFIIAEAGVNHNGSEQMALDLIDCAAESGADAVKFQTFRASELVAKGTSTADYQKQATGNTDQYQMLKELELSWRAYEVLFRRCEHVGIEFMSTPFNLDAAQFLVKIGMKRIKVPSGEVTNLPYITELAKLRTPMILSTGMSTLDEVSDAVKAIANVWNPLGIVLEENLTVLHCTSNYPAADEDVNLKAMVAMGNALCLPVGYSDHTDGNVVSIAAVSQGATVIEKHFTLDRSLPGPDHRASLEPNELTDLVAAVRRVERCMGNGIKEPRVSELAVRDLVRRSITLRRDLKAGSIVAEEDIHLLRPGTGVPPKFLQDVIGRKLKRSLKAGCQPRWEDLN